MSLGWTDELRSGQCLWRSISPNFEGIGSDFHCKVWGLTRMTIVLRRISIVSDCCIMNPVRVQQISWDKLTIQKNFSLLSKRQGCNFVPVCENQTLILVEFAALKEVCRKTVMQGIKSLSDHCVLMWTEQNHYHLFRDGFKGGACPLIFAETKTIYEWTPRCRCFSS